MANYTNISKEEMEAFLFPKGFVPVHLENTKELVYAKRIVHKLALSLRVYTGINPDGASRDVGKDAIRVCLFWRNIQGEIKSAGGSKRVHRVNGWRFNLQNRLDNWEQDFVTCSACGSPMVERKGHYGYFLGCCNYPNCKATRPLRKKTEEAKEQARRDTYKETPINLSNLPEYDAAHEAEDEAEREVLRLESLYS